jgi:TetR/AcrR family transcriptional regulator, cholesterol catabolism regulator
MMPHQDSIRRERPRSLPASIVAAAADLACGGYDAFRMRDVANRAGVSPGTIYRYFESKDDLLMACLHQWLDSLVEVTWQELSSMSESLERLRHLAAFLTLELADRPLLADAFGHAYLFASSAGTARSDSLRLTLIRMFSFALDGVDRTNDGVGDLIADVWAANIPAIVQQRRSVPELQERLVRAVAAARAGGLLIVPGIER